MKCVTTVFVFLTICFSLSVAAAHNKAVVIPLNSAKKLANVVTVSAQGGDFTNPVAAVNSITNASASNPYVVLIGPGVYTMTETLVMKEYVSVIGTGEQSTKLTGAIWAYSFDASTAIISGADHATLSDLTVENTGPTNYSSGIWNENSSPVIQDVTVSVSGLYCYGVLNSSSSPTMTHMSVTVSSEANARGVDNTTSSSPTMSNVKVTTTTASGTGSSYAVDNNNSSPTMTNVTATASGGQYTAAVLIEGTSSLVTIKNSTLKGVKSIVTQGVDAKAKVAGTLLDGAVAGIGLTCVGAYDVNFAALNIACF